MPPMRRSVLSIGTILVIAVSGCGGGSSDSSSTSSSQASSHPLRIPIPGGRAPIRHEGEMKVDASGLAGPEPKPVFPKGPPPEFVVVANLVEGIGEIHEGGEPVTVQYVGYDY